MLDYEIFQLDEINMRLVEQIDLREKLNDTESEALEGITEIVNWYTHLDDAYNDMLVGLNDLTQSQVNSTMAIGAAQQDGAKAAGAAASAYILAELQKAIASFITDAFAKYGIFGAIVGAGASGVVGQVFQRALAGSKKAFAAEGMNEIVTEPTLIVAGEAGAEYVDIEPLTNEGAGRNGGVNITFSGNVMSDDFITQTAIPKIREAIRKGEDIGIG